MKLITTGLAFLLSVLVSSSQGIPYILNGTSAGKNELKYMAGIFIGDYALCGAAVIDERHLLTAAHCVWNKEENRTYLASIFTGRAGEYDIRSADNDGTEQVIDVGEIFAHPDYKNRTGGNANDLAVMRLKKPLTFNEAVQPIRLPKAGHISTGVALASGWGRNGTDYKSNVLQKLFLPIVNEEICKAAYDFFSEAAGINPHIHICAGYRNGGRDTCKGDSGGPLVAFDDDDGQYLAGIVSWGIGCGLKERYGVYVRVSVYLDWIQSIVNS